MAVPASHPSRPDVGWRARGCGVLAAALLVAACAGPDADAPSDPDASPDAVTSTSTEPDGSEEPVEVDNCGLDVRFDTPPERIVGLNSGSVDALLALGVEDRIVGALGRAESIRDDLRGTFEQLPLLDTDTESYPSSEVVLELEPELIYSVYPSAFRDTGIASRTELADLGVRSYLAPGRCPDRDPEEPLEFEEIWTEFRQLGALLGVEDAAEELIAEQQAAVESVRDDLPDIEDVEVVWWDAGTDEPMVGACCGAPGMMLRELGVSNAFGDLPDHWATISWEQVIERDPDVVVMVDFGDDDIADKREYVETDPTLRELRAFREDAVVVLPFSQTTPGLQNVTAVETLGAFLADLDDDT